FGIVYDIFQRAFDCRLPFFADPTLHLGLRHLAGVSWACDIEGSRQEAAQGRNQPPVLLRLVIESRGGRARHRLPSKRRRLSWRKTLLWDAYPSEARIGIVLGRVDGI